MCGFLCGGCNKAFALQRRQVKIRRKYTILGWLGFIIVRLNICSPALLLCHVDPGSTPRRGSAARARLMRAFGAHRGAASLQSAPSPADFTSCFLMMSSSPVYAAFFLNDATLHRQCRPHLTAVCVSSPNPKAKLCCNTRAVLRKRKTAFLIPTESEAEPPVTAESDTYQYLVNSRLPSL